MALREHSTIGKTIYGALFLVGLPVLLVAWAKATSDVVALPNHAPPALGLAAVAAGALIMLAGMIALWEHGGGLPMNLYPPPRYVTRGIYRFTAHPIYLGFCAICAGASISARSSSGLWLVSPVVILSCTALVLGYETHDLRRRFGHQLPLPSIRLPGGDPLPPAPAERLSVYFLVLIPWIILYEAVRGLGVPPDSVSAVLPFERRLPVIEWTEIFYASAYPLVFAVPLVAGTRRALRRFSIHGLLSMALVFPLFLAVPLIAPPRLFTPHGPFGELLVWERSIDTAAAAFPSFHVVWVLLAAEVFASRMPGLRLFWRAWAWLVAASCVTTGMHAVVDVLAGFAVVAIVARSAALWEQIRSLSERLANSWKEWHFGPVRVINHGVYAGVAAFAGLVIVGWLTGPGHGAAILLAAGSGLAGAALWAQQIEGSPRLLRPYGFNGGLLGTALGALLAPWFGSGTWLMLGAFSVAGPWIQSLGRLRCLVQGCCHGSPAPPHVGIRYLHPRSRVCVLSALAGAPLHPTPVYSIAWNVYVAVAMARLWMLHAPLHLIAGLYLILTGLGRFVEEAYRGEPQTPIVARLRFYQWVAVASVIFGALLTAAGNGAAAPAPQFNWESVRVAALFGLVAAFSLGVDFPGSKRRFARLA